MSQEPSIPDRLAIRVRPSSFPLMHQNWGKLLFVHWAIDAEILRPLIPSQLSIDTFDGKAWIGLKLRDVLGWDAVRERVDIA